MFKHLLIGSWALVSLSGCGQTAQGEAEFQNARISRNSDSTLTITDGQKTIDVSSVEFPEQNVTLRSGNVTQMVRATCCYGCSCENGSCSCQMCAEC